MFTYTSYIYIYVKKQHNNSSSDVTFTPTWIRPSIIRTRPKGSVSHTSTCLEEEASGVAEGIEVSDQNV